MLSNVQRVHDILVCITYTDTNTIICNKNNTTSFSKQIHHKNVWTYHYRRRSHIWIVGLLLVSPLKNSLSFSKRLIIVPKHLEFGNKNNSLDIHSRSSFRITTKKSLKFYKPLNIVGKYQELILILNHLNHDDLPYVRLSKIKKGIYAHYQCYAKQCKGTQPFFSAVGNCNGIRHFYHLHDTHVAGMYCPFLDKVIDDSTLPTINKAFVHDPTHPLSPSSDNGIDLIYVPTIYSAFDSWK